VYAHGAAKSRFRAGSKTQAAWAERLRRFSGCVGMVDSVSYSPNLGSVVN
jgi:hypothetical protein